MCLVDRWGADVRVPPGRLGKGLLDWLSGSFDKLQADISEVDIAKYAGLADSEGECFATTANNHYLIS